MAHNPEWHAKYRQLENAEIEARETFREAKRRLTSMRPPVDAQARYDAAIDAFRAAGKARWDFEMADAKIVDIATLPVTAWVSALR